MSNDSPQIVALRARYKASFNEKKDIIDGFIKQLQKQQSDESVLSSLHGELHKLAGSSGMYGYDDISVKCRNIMQEILNDCFHEVLSDLTQLSELLSEYMDSDR